MKYKHSLQGIYAITDDSLTSGETILDQISEAVKAGVKTVQLRDKTSYDDELIDLCYSLKLICKFHRANFIINDRVALAKKIKADGIHIGINNLSVPETRATLGENYIIGVSCYGDVQRAIQAKRDGADYVAFGSFFPSPIKPNSEIVSTDIIKQAKEQLNIPVCVIGGINHENITTLKPFNPDMYALVSAIFKDNSITEKVKQLNNLISN